MKQTSTPATTPNKKKREKPWEGFPLFWHQRGYWAVKRGGKQIAYTADDKESYRLFLKDEESRNRGESSARTSGKYLLRDAINRMFTRCVDRHAAGKMGNVQLAKWRFELQTALPRAISVNTPLSAFRKQHPRDETPADTFRRIRRAATLRGPNAAHRHIVMIRKTLTFAAAKGLMQPPDFGEDFEAPSKHELDKARVNLDMKHGQRAWSIPELRKIIAAAGELAKQTVSTRGNAVAAQNPHLQAQILMGLFAGFASDDLSAIPESTINRETGIVSFPRVKPQEFRPRACYLPKRVLQAIDVSIAGRPKAADKDAAGLLFRSESGRRCNAAKVHSDEIGVLSAGRNDTIGKNFARLLKRIGLNRKRTGFKTLRAMSRTLMLGADVDSEIIKVIMGRRFSAPVDEFYIRGDMRAKLVQVAAHIERQLFPKRVR